MTLKNAYVALAQDVDHSRAPDTPSEGVTFISAPTSLSPTPSDDGFGIKERWRTMRSRLADFVDINAGMLLIIFAQLFFSFMNVAVKGLNSLDPPVPALELIVVRMVITFTCCVLYMVIMKIPDPFLGPKGVRLLLACRGFCGFFGLFGMYFSLQYLSLADATVLTFLGPLATAVAGYFILKENYSKKEALAGICSLMGVILIARPPFLFGNIQSINPDSEDAAVKATPAERFKAVGVALLGVTFGTGALISIRAIGKRAHPLHSMTFFSLWCVIVATGGMIVGEVPVVYPTRWEWVVLLILIGLCGFFAQTLVTMGLQRETAARGAMGVYIQVIFAGVLERIVFHTVPTMLSMIGAGIIMTSAVFVVMTKKNTPDNKSRGVVLEDVEGSALEEGLLNGRHSESHDEPMKLEDVDVNKASVGDSDGINGTWPDSPAPFENKVPQA
ncbi:hypothetical protein SERLA73DRAFT_184151 [Serpula lacrymans var. lacrymans S7.3]|uniref:EamA domain-containing protein n=2 Tax=Serpula lacrymans var. lacrymans TaxID=341189 RepID=F8Q2N0_SERL3|nr:uncharacterized protein SERLADRAFT_362358 [Serpula lacrymans var. lacrymans S7.9]EGN97441.1 hypothetical protein SERLA73DRAFT_184151 [Serpula lacrymans var. lacrymans S7.3]EGO23033.1 hypothetical protein SERLADRAFT_362358 [Serpula lacrymans var. lacrymans S7.9]